ncbi:hypothetical protein [Vitiosangium sp. GDMCC 1.1324]|uniref:hypothetical protein n=1 Tax=Vitiosangium sp. (strain GDMCC 1.1324) TaxID=2138576 RepID=UPI000D3658F9|nr:hypothetical protein [Vitiosangium sp. GDMCC 1.1324]PTL81345.1 hypothetical protein DAT35_24860 [Vitiosangium sp. GDMCC 1.1324]
MRWRRVFTFMSLMAVGTGGPETWREGGTIDRAMAKDVEEELHRHNCDLSQEEWKRRCKVPADWADRDCPHECRFRGAE